MNRELAEELIAHYFNAWVKKDMEAFKRVLHNHAVVRECTGAVIKGEAALHRWFAEWNHSDNQVIHWHIRHVGYDDNRDIAFIEWNFKCVYESQQYEWDGASIVSFKDALISEVNEYEMKKEKFFPYTD